MAPGSVYCGTCGTLQRQAPVGAPFRPPGWFPDPFGRAWHRFFDGVSWSEHVFSGTYGLDPLPGQVEQSQAATPGTAHVLAPAVPAASPPLRAMAATPAPTHENETGGVGTADVGTADVGTAGPEPFTGSLAGALGILVVGLVGAFAVSLLGVVLLIAAGRPGGILVELVVSEVGLWAGLLVTCVIVSHRYGTGNLRRDVVLRFRPIDVAIGFGAAIVAHCIGAAVLVPIELAHRSVTNPDTPVLGPLTLDWVGWLVLTAVVCVGAPFVEEIFFRGVLQRELIQRFGPQFGVIVTAIVFGAVHIANDPGLNGAIYAAGIGASGLVLGTVRYMTGRLGSSIATHAFFNGLALTALAVTIAT